MDLKSRWNELHSASKLAYPDDRVVAWAMREWHPSKGRRQLLDLGCGSGRHALMLARVGHRVSAVDFSWTGLDEVRRRAAGEQLIVDACLGTADVLPFANQVFDGVLCYGVLYYLSWDRFCTAAREIYRVLWPGGSALVVTRTDQDGRAVHGHLLGPLMYEVRATEDGSFQDEAGMTLTLIGEADVLAVFTGFEQIIVDQRRFTQNGRRIVNDDWIIHATR